MESTIVVKVKYGKTLRRFNARVDKAGKLELSTNELRDKVISLFKLSLEVDLALTYLDEDGDLVTLADDEDLHDVMKQSLDPLRITAKVNTEKGNNNNNNSSRSNGDPTSIKSPPIVFHPLPNHNINGFQSLRVESFFNMLRDPSFIATVSSQPNLPKLLQPLSEMMKTLTIANSQKGTESAKSLKKEPEALGDDGAKKKAVTFSNSVIQPCRGKNTSFAPGPNSVTLSADQSSDGKKEVKKSGESSLNGKSALKNTNAVASPFSPSIFRNPNVSLGLFNNQPTTKESTFSNSQFGPRVPPFKRCSSQSGAIFHKGVRCDVCGVHPITGPRFKSKVKHDYDLCSICFAEMGSEAEYIRLDRPMPPIPYRHLHYVKSARANPPPYMPKTTGVVKPNRPKLDSRFVTDVNVIDGTVMAPSTLFTKIWRMRNNGSLVWPHGTQLVWIGGEKLSASFPADLQIPLDGIAVENELEIAIDFMAPELPGRYISYWRMASPSGQKFGQRIWVLIQVDASECNDNWQGLNLNLPPQSNDLGETKKGLSIIADTKFHIPELSNKSTDLVEPIVPLPTKDQDIEFPINDNLLVNAAVDSNDVLNLTEASISPPPMPAVADESNDSGGENDYEKILLRELEEMGFKQVDLNKEILRVNEYNMEQSVDDLCGVSEWDPILEELQEMGFCDNEVNKKLLKKNNGSIKGVVMDLITGDKV